MIHVFFIIFTGVIASLFFFSFEFTFLPGFNTKKILAMIGLFLLLYRLAQKKNALFNINIFNLSLFAAMVSILAYISVVYNNTTDYAYTTYFISMWVWLSSAYTIVSLMRRVHNRISLEIICNYLIMICVGQCIMALAIDFIPSLKNLVNMYIGSISGMGSAAEFSGRARLYGIGAAVDVAGTRFAAIEIMIAYLFINSKKLSKEKQIFYILAFWIISVIGNMIARTTTIGMLLAIVYCTYSTFYNKKDVRIRAFSFWKIMLYSATILLPFLLFLYFTNTQIHQYIRFGFEGFFSLFESGEWEVHSNEILRTMYRLPTTLKTWLIGDGYFDNPMSDPYYIGYSWKGFYMGTDVGYLRFIFYFGVLGLISFVLFIIKTVMYCMANHTRHKTLLLLLLILSFTIWFKVSTDIFLVFALFLCISKEEEEEAERRELAAVQEQA